MNQNKMDKKTVQILACSLAVGVMILLLSGDMIISQIIKVNPNQDYQVEEENKTNDEVFPNLTGSDQLNESVSPNKGDDTGSNLPEPDPNDQPIDAPRED